MKQLNALITNMESQDLPESQNEYINNRLTKWDKFKQYFFAAPAIILFLTIMYGLLTDGEVYRLGVILSIMLFPIAIISYNSTMRKVFRLKEEWWKMDVKNKLK